MGGEAKHWELFEHFCLGQCPRKKKVKYSENLKFRQATPFKRKANLTIGEEFLPYTGRGSYRKIHRQELNTK